jgi:acyl CoA:acetate/3-ketoacid CoA transferase beta subunit
MSYNPTEMMTVAAARTLRDSDICFVGIGMPSAACNLARLTHAPGITHAAETPPPTEHELCVLRALHARTARAHGEAA